MFSAIAKWQCSHSSRLNTAQSQIAKKRGISPKSVETHCEHIKLELGYPDAEALRRGAREVGRHS
jgi:DNA-binding CsgD family transcriptional regulator